jgi:hypothetical protein
MSAKKVNVEKQEEVLEYVTMVALDGIETRLEERGSWQHNMLLNLEWVEV